MVGLLFELAATGDRTAADASMAEFTALVRAAVPDPTPTPRSPDSP